MKIKDLIKELQKYDGDLEVAIYNSSTGGPLWIPSYDLDFQVMPDEDFAAEWNFPKGTVFIKGK